MMLKKRVIGMLLLISLMGVACGKAVEGDNQQEEIVENVQEETEGKNEINQQIEEKEDLKKEPTIAPIASPEKEEIALPEIDDKYKYHLYCLECIDDKLNEEKTWANPCIGVNDVEGWKINGFHLYSILEDEKSYIYDYGDCIAELEKEMSDGDKKPIYISFKKEMDNDYIFFIRCVNDGRTTGILSPEYNESMEIDFERPRVINKEKKATIDTAFGEAEIYWICKGYNNDVAYMTFYDEGFFDKMLEENPDAKYEENGNTYLLAYEEVASLEIGEHQIEIRIDNIMTLNFDKEYKGQLEEIISQMFEAK